MADKFDKFTEQVRRVLTLAEEEAQRFNHNDIGTEHLLLGLIREGDGVAARVLIDLRVEVQKVREMVLFIMGRGEGQVVGGRGLVPRAKKVIELAVDEARRLNHHRVGTEHLLLGLVREDDSIACGLLESMGVSLDRVRTQVMQIIDPTGSSATTAMPAGRSTHFAGASWHFGAGGPAFRDLLQIISVAQSQRSDDIELSLLSLESYADGFILTLRLLLPEQEILHRIVPNIACEARDDQGTSYTGHLDAGSQRQGQWRFSYGFSPTLASAARELQVHVPVLNWRPGSWPADRPEPGPWAFTIALPPPEATVGG